MSDVAALRVQQKEHTRTVGCMHTVQICLRCHYGP